MGPSKANIGDVEGSSKGEGQSLLGLTSSLAHLSLHPDNPKDLVKLEATLAKVTLDDTHTEEEDVKKNEEEEEENVEEREAEKSGTEEEEEEKVEEREAEKSDTEEEEKEEKTTSEDVTQEKKEVVDEEKVLGKEVFLETKEEEDSKEKDEEEAKGDENPNGIVKEEEDKSSETVKEEKREEEVKEKNKEEEEEVSDDENPPETETNTETKKLRPRGLLQGSGNGYSASSHLDYQGLQQQQQQQQQQMQMQQPSLGSQYVGLSSPQYGQVAGYAGASPTHSGATGEMWYSSGQLDTECDTSLFPSLAEGSPVSICSSVEGGDSQQMLWGGYGGMDSPQHQYHDGSSSYYPSPQCQELSYSQYQASPSYQYQPSPPYYPDNSLPQGIQSPCYQDMGYQTGGYQEGGYVDGVYQESPFSNSTCTPPTVHATPITPPISPPLAETAPTVRGNREVEDIIEAVTSVMHDDEPVMPLDESRIIQIKRNLMDIEQCTILREELNQEKYMEYYRACARLRDEELVEADEDGDIKIMVAAAQGQEQAGYSERLVALTERMEHINLCCKDVVDWHINQCRHCGNDDREQFYSPLSWMNNYGQMVLSNAVVTMYPVPVVKYLTRKVMQRQIDFKRTFSKHRTLFYNQQHVYPCLAEPLRMLNEMERKHKEHNAVQHNTTLAPHHQH